MEKIDFEEKIVAYLGLPSLPQKTWDGRSSFKHGVATIEFVDGRKAYAVCSYDSETDKQPRITKVFSLEPFKSFDVESIRVVPTYMDVDGVENWDLDEKSKKAAQGIIDEGNAMIAEGKEDKVEVPENEYCYPQITSDEEAIAFLRARANGRGHLPTTHEGIVAKLTAMWMDEQNNNKKFNNKKNRRK